MKKTVQILILFFVMFYFHSCENETETINDPNAPTIQMNSTKISTASGTQFVIMATITDDLGISSINLSQPDWYLNKTINLADSAPNVYELNYKFLVPETETEMENSLMITVEDVGGNKTTQELTITLDKDLVLPTITIKKPIGGTNFKAGDKISFFVEVTDNKGINTFELTASELGIDTLISFNPVNAKYIFVKDYFIPDLLPSGEYFINVSAKDSTNNMAAITISITVGDVAPDRVYIVGGASFGGWQPDNPMPMNPDIANPGWYELETYSYGIKDYNNFKFIGQKAWGPLNWGLKSGSTTEMVNAENSEAIVLPEAGYYKVRFNPIELKFTTEKVTPSTAIKPNLYLLGSGLTGMDMAWDNSSKALTMTQNADNPYIFTTTAEFSAKGFEDWGANFIFISNTENVSELALGFKEIPEESLDPAWLDYPGYVIGNLAMSLTNLTDGELANITSNPPASVWNNVPYIAYYDQAGQYEIKVDYHLKQVSITKVNK